jgi:hypothetical protein
MNKITYQHITKIAEYLALARSLKETSPDTDYRRANQLSWELATYLPAEMYKQITYAIAAPNETTNPLSVIIAIRKHFLKNGAGELTMNDIAQHAPGIGKKSL